MKGLLIKLGVTNPEPSKELRVDFFGYQPRFVFAENESTVIQGLTALVDALGWIVSGKVDDREMLYDPSRGGESGRKDRIPNRLMQLHYDTERTEFFTKPTSSNVMYLVSEKVRTMDENRIRKMLLEAKPSGRFYGDMFEACVDGLLWRGTKCRVRGFQKDMMFEEGRMGPYDVVGFYYKYFNRAYVLFEDANNTRLLGTTPITRPLLFRQARDRCATIDTIVVEPPKDGERRGRVVYIQTTVQESHRIKPPCFFSMLLFVRMVEHVNGWKEPTQVVFMFVVDEIRLHTFTCPDREYLPVLFGDDVEVKVCALDILCSSSSSSSSSSSFPSSPPSSSSSFSTDASGGAMRFEPCCYCVPFGVLEFRWGKLLLRVEEKMVRMLKEEEKVVSDEKEPSVPDEEEKRNEVPVVLERRRRTSKKEGDWQKTFEDVHRLFRQAKAKVKKGKGEEKEAEVIAENGKGEDESKYYNVIPGGKNNSEGPASSRTLVVSFPTWIVMKDVCRLIINLFFPLDGIGLSGLKCSDGYHSLALEFISVRSKMNVEELLKVFPIFEYIKSIDDRKMEGKKKGQ
jgi:hypothetical protein